MIRALTSFIFVIITVSSIMLAYYGWMLMFIGFCEKSPLYGLCLLLGTVWYASRNQHLFTAIYDFWLNLWVASDKLHEEVK